MAAVASRAMSLGRAERKPLSASQSRSDTPIAALANCWWLRPNRRVSCGVMSNAASVTARAATGRMKRIIAADCAPQSVRRAPHAIAPRSGAGGDRPSRQAARSRSLSPRR